MWLKLSFFSDRESLLAVVMSDGNVYFKASDVAKFLGYTNKYSFAKRYATRDFRKMIPWTYLLPRPHGKDGDSPANTTRVFDFEEMILTIQKTLPNHRIICDEKRIEELRKLWSFGLVSIKKGVDQMPDPINHTSYRNPFLLEVRMGRQNVDDDVVNFQEWIREFSNRVKKMFEDVSNFLHSREEKRFSPMEEQQQNGSSMLAKSNKLISDCYDTPPPSVNNECYYSSPPPSCSTSYVDTEPQNFQSSQSFYPVFGLEYDGFENNLPEEIHINIRGIKHVYVQKKYSL